MRRHRSWWQPRWQRHIFHRPRGSLPDRLLVGAHIREISRRRPAAPD
ncbi:MAG: hypothetical protein ACYCTZ_10795 [Candidatus Dormibacteria bacterium]